jgi:hypothetical protein
MSVDSSKQRTAMLVTQLKGQTVSQTAFNKLIATEQAAQQFAGQAAQMDQKWIVLSRAAAGIVSDPIEPSPNSHLLDVLRECTAQGLG